AAVASSTSSSVPRPLCAARSLSFFPVSQVKCTSIAFMIRKNLACGKLHRVSGGVAVCRSGGFTPPCGEVNSPLHHQTETLPGFQVFTRSSKYDPASPKRTSGDHAATTGGNWLRFPIASNKLEIDQ